MRPEVWVVIAGLKLQLGALEAEARGRGPGQRVGSRGGSGQGGGGGGGEFALTGLVGEWPGSRRWSSCAPGRLAPDSSGSGREDP